jgi:hypothetical protein
MSDDGMLDRLTVREMVDNWNPGESVELDPEDMPTEVGAERGALVAQGAAWLRGEELDWPRARDVGTSRA